MDTRDREPMRLVRSYDRALVALHEVEALVAVCVTDLHRHGDAPTAATGEARMRNRLMLANLGLADALEDMEQRVVQIRDALELARQPRATDQDVRGPGVTR